MKLRKGKWNALFFLSFLQILYNSGITKDKVWFVNTWKTVHKSNYSFCNPFIEWNIITMTHSLIHSFTHIDNHKISFLHSLYNVSLNQSLTHTFSKLGIFNLPTHSLNHTNINSRTHEINFHWHSHSYTYSFIKLLFLLLAHSPTESIFL